MGVPQLKWRVLCANFEVITVLEKLVVVAVFNVVEVFCPFKRKPKQVRNCSG